MSNTTTIMARFFAEEAQARRFVDSFASSGLEAWMQKSGDKWVVEYESNA